MNNFKIKSFMYHYVREDNDELKFSKHKQISIFEKECNLFKSFASVINISDLFQINNLNSDIVTLTFDDGLKDHLNVAEILNSLGLKATFYISTAPYLNEDILPVHKCHQIISKVGPDCLSLLYEALDRLGIGYEDSYSIQEKEKFINKYKNQKDLDQIKEFKKIINYYGNIDIQNKILNQIIERLSIDKNINSYYLNKNEIQYLDKLGFEIGSHSVKHTLLSRLSKRMQKVELLNSKLFLENLLKKRVFSFCYPYGGSDSYDRNTLKLLSDIGYLNAVTVDSKDIDLRSLKKDKFEIPRYDCNQISKMFFKKI